MEKKRFLFYDDLINNFEGFVEDSYQLVHPDFFVGNRKIKNEKEYTKWYNETYPGNLYVEFMLKNDHFEKEYFGGLPNIELETITKMANDGDIISVIFDWDRTLSICEGFFNIDLVVQHYNMDLREYLFEYLIPYLLGDETRRNIIQYMFNALSEHVDYVFIITNNPEKHMKTMISEFLKYLKMPEDFQPFFLQKGRYQNISKADLLQQAIRKNNVWNHEDKNKLMQGFFGKPYLSFNSKPSPLSLSLPSKYGKKTYTRSKRKIRKNNTLLKKTITKYTKKKNTKK